MEDNDDFPAPNATEENLEKTYQKLLSKYTIAYEMYSQNDYEVMKLLRLLLWCLFHFTDKLESFPELQEKYETARQSLIKKVKDLYKECSLTFLHTPSKTKVIAFNSLKQDKYKELSFFEKLLWQSGDPLFNYIYFSDQKLKNSLSNIWTSSNKWKTKTIFLYGPYEGGKSLLVKGICEIKGAQLLEISNTQIINKHSNFFHLLYYLCAAIYPLAIHFENIENIKEIMGKVVAFCKRLEDSHYEPEKKPLVFFSSNKYIPSKLPVQIKEHIYCWKEITYPTNKVDLINFFALKRMMYIDISRQQKEMINNTYTDFTNKSFELAIEQLDSQKDIGISSKKVEIYTCKELTNLLNTFKEMK